MDEDYDYLGTYNDDPIHDMYVDADYEINTGELSDWCDGGNLDDYLNAEEE